MSAKTKKHLLTLMYALCGALCALPSIAGFLWILGFVAFVPVLYCEYTREAENKHPVLRAWKRGLTFFYAYGLVTFYWFIELYPLDFAGLTRPAALAVVLVAWLGLPLLQGVVSAFMLIPLTILRRTKHSFFLYPLTAASLWVVFEWLQTQTWAGVPWGKLALGQTSRLENIQSASLLGSYFISFIMIFISGLLAVSIINLQNKETLRRGICCLAAAVLIFEANSIYGTVAIKLFNNTEKGEPLKVAAIQANIASDEKWSDKVSYTLDIYSDLTLKAVKEGAELVIWPETALPYELNLSDNLKKYLCSLSEEAGVPILAGTFVRDTNEDKLHNVICYVTPGDGISENTYEKRRLVPFGEFVPWRNFFMTVIPPLAELSILSEDVTPGNSPSVFNTQFCKIGSLICFDSIFEDLALDSVRDGAELICISTNDSWFHDSAAVYQHNSHAILRSVETGRYIVRAANTGISSVITSTGEVTDMLPPLVEGYIVSDIYPSDTPTLYTYIGNSLVLLCGAFTVLRLILLLIKEIKNGHNHNKG